MNGADTAWIIVATALVLFMTLPGLALFYGGLVRARNVLSVFMHCYAIACLMSVLWFALGYSIAFGGGDSGLWGGLDKVLLLGLSADDLAGTLPEVLFFAFQMTFAIITPALIVGAYVERIKFSAVVLFSGLWLIIVYAPSAHWIWGGGLLANLEWAGLKGYATMDFAGGLVVHANAGIAALIIAKVLGPRRGFPSELRPPHNPGMVMIGAAMLWVGWFGFNAGSAVAANGGAGMAMAVTQIAAATAAVSWMVVEWIFRRKPSVLGIISGAVAGLVAITPASGYVDPFGALIIGLAAGLVCYWGAVVLKPKMGYDDTLDVFGVHGLGGITGALLTGVFAVEAIGGTPGLLEGNAGQVLIQLEGIIATIVYCAIATFIILKVVGAVMGLRVDEESEVGGLDYNLHGETVK